MSRKTVHNNIIKLFTELHNSYPNYNIGRHIATALSDYGDYWGITNEEFAFALTKYKDELDMDVSHKEDEIDEIIKQGMHLDSILKDEDEEDN